MPPFLALKFLGLARWAWLLIALAAIVGLIWWFNAVEKADDAANQKIGRTEAVNEGHETTLGQVGAANEAGSKVRAGRSRAKYEQCVQDSEPGFAGNCERYRPDEPVPD